MVNVNYLMAGGNSLSSFWRRVKVQPPDNDDLQDIVKVCYPSLEPLAEKLIGVLSLTE